MHFALSGISVLLPVLAVLMSIHSARAQTLNESVIDYRQQIMKSKEAQAQAIGAILTGTVPDHNIASHFESLLLANRQTKKAFELEVQGGKAQPEIWKNWPDFSAKLDRIEAALVKAIDVTRKHGGGAAGDVALEALGCQGCHDVYKKP